jgi:hypothetical protein
LGHFWLIFGFIFGSFSRVWQKNDQNDPKNGIKNDMKMATVNTLESKNNKNEAKMHFTWSSAVLASARHIQTPPQTT